MKIIKVPKERKVVLQRDVVVPRELPNLATGALKARGHTTARTFADYFGDIINVKGMGAKGDGIADDRAAIQSALDLAFGPAGSPHGDALKFMNRPVFFPAGDYRVGGPLYLTKVVGGHIFGSGTLSTKLTYVGAFSGNSVVGNGLTAIFMTNGFANSRLENMHLSIADNNSTCFYLYSDGTPGGGGPTGNAFVGILVDSATAGFLIGYQTLGGLCSESLFTSCFATGCHYGFRNIDSNALNNNFVSCGADHCVEGFSCPTGSIHIHAGSLAVNGLDILTGQQPMTIIGTRTESQNFIDTTSSSGVTHFVSGCVQDAPAAGYFINLGGANKGVLDACTQNGSVSTYGKVVGTTGSKVYLRGCIFNNSSYLAGFTGTIGQNI